MKIKPRTVREQQIANEYQAEIELRIIQLKGCYKIFCALVDEMDSLDSAGVLNASEWRDALKKAAKALEDYEWGVMEKVNKKLDFEVEQPSDEELKNRFDDKRG